MMKKLFLLLTVVLLTYSCSIDDDGQRVNYYYTTTTDVDMPDSFEVGETYDIPVTFDVPGECYAFSGFEVVRGENNGRGENTTRTVRVILSGFNETLCDEDITTSQTRDLKFQVIYTEDYTFRFFKGVDDDGNPEFLEYIVPVNE